MSDVQERLICISSYIQFIYLISVQKKKCSVFLPFEFWFFLALSQSQDGASGLEISKQPPETIYVFFVRFIFLNS